MLPSYIFLILGVLFPCSYGKRPMFYRKDYTYIERYDAFYKIHWDPKVDSWNAAFKVCDDEGAQLFYPEMVNEWEVVKDVEEKSAVRPDLREIFIGLHDEFKIGHSTASPLEVPGGSSTHNNCVGMDIDSGSFTSYSCVDKGVKPFVCKRAMDTVNCSTTVDREYKYAKSVNKCYKVHKKQMDWNSAMRTCYMEGGLLAILETGSDISTIQQLGIKNSNYYYIGFRKMFNINEFYTVKGKVYENNNFRDWYRPEDNVGSDCGLLYPDSSDIRLDNCDEEHEFICEIDLN